MSFLLFHGCQIPARLPQFAWATREVLSRFGIDWIENPDFNCCGYPMRNRSVAAFALSAARNMAIAEKAGHDMLVMCKCCFGAFMHARDHISREETLKADINRRLAAEGLHYGGLIEVRHLLSVLRHEVGIDAVRQAAILPYNGLVVAASYGCHALRPGSVTQFDNPAAPTIFDDLVSATGAYSTFWNRRLDCCGAPLRGVNDELSIAMAVRKMSDAREAGAHVLCTACPYSHIQFETVQQQLMAEGTSWKPIPLILYPQLLGLAMGINSESLGFDRHLVDIRGIQSYLSGKDDGTTNVRSGDGGRRRDLRHAVGP